MNSDLVVRSDQPPTFAAWLPGIALALAVVLGAWILIYALINGPQMRAAAESQTAQEVEQENRELCGKLGITAETQAFVTCTATLVHVRQRHDERRNRDLDF